MADEFARIARIAAALRTHGDPRLISRSIGDDCAVLDPTALGRGERLVWTVDAQVEHVHFERAWLSMRDLGWRATVAAMSDVLAMGARPLAMLSAWTIDPTTDDDAIDALAAGQNEACEALGAAIVGGNISSGAALSLTTTALGGATRAIARDGAKKGEIVAIAGAIGEAALGLEALRRGLDAAEHAQVVTAWRRPPVLLSAARALASANSSASAAIDVSDGLAQDLGHLARASGIAIELDGSSLLALLSSAATRAAIALGVDALELELTGGEDYAIVATFADHSKIPAPFVPIGRCVAGVGVEIVHADGRRSTPRSGYVHGADAPLIAPR